MPTNQYFDNFTSQAEQNLIHDLIIESINIYGHDMYYLPRTLKNLDEIYGEDTVSEYNNHILTTMYVKSFDNYAGDGQFLSKFNLEIRDQIIFTVSQREINDELNNVEGIRRPQEGDLIYSAMFKRMFVIQYVDKQAIFYQMGDLQTYDLTCEVWEYSSEKLRTGIPEIDRLETEYSTDIEEAGILTANGELLDTEDDFSILIGQYSDDEQNQDTFAENDEISEEAEDVVDWSERDPFSDGG